VIAPIGFVSDHMEIVFDLDTQARELCEELGLNMLRAHTVGTHPRFIAMIGELIRERTDENRPRLALGAFGPRPDICPADCCPTPERHQQDKA
jgi:ferrochelatase